MIGAILGIVNKFIPDQAKRDELKTELTSEMTKQMKMQADIIKAEQQSGSYLTRNWRPLFMVLCGVIIGTHWFIYDIIPYIRTVFGLNFWIPQDPGLSNELWTTIRLGLGGYIGGRTAEKVVKIIKS